MIPPAGVRHVDITKRERLESLGSECRLPGLNLGTSPDDPICDVLLSGTRPIDAPRSVGDIVVGLASFGFDAWSGYRGLSGENATPWVRPTPG